MKRMALAQLDLAIELVQGKGDVPSDEAVHDTRKALKRLRALVRLLRKELGEQAFARENGALRDIARRLAGARDAEVMASTLERLLHNGHERRSARRDATKLRRLHPVGELRVQLAAERDRATNRGLGDAATRDATLGEMYAVRRRVMAWSLPERPGFQLTEPGLRLLYRQGRRRYGRALRAKPRDTRALHQWRKRVKDLRYAAQILGLRELAGRADDLQEWLGEEHDLALLAARVSAPDSPLAGGGKRRRRARKEVLKLIARRRARLRKRALRQGRRLYEHKPKRFAKHTRKRLTRARREARGAEHG
jgi:CHAD domain-containing protein